MPSKFSKKHIAKLATRQNVLICALIFVIAFACAFFVFDVSDKIAKAYYTNKVKNALNSENEKLGNPLEAMGFVDINKTGPVCVEVGKEIAAMENTEDDANKKATLHCNYQLQSYHVIGDNKAAQEQVVAAATELKTKLEQNGWDLDDEDLVEWFTNLTSGVDYQPDNYIHKFDEKNKTLCVLDFTTAFSKPDPIAVNATFNCSLPESHQE